MNETVAVLLPQRGVSKLETVGPADVVERYGVRPDQVIDFIALRGDQSDRIPGAKGIGPVRAAALLAEHGSLAAILEAGHLAQEAVKVRLYRDIATMQADAPIPPLPDREPDWPAAAAWARSSGLDNLARRLDAR